jgi:hypothetical protein
MIGPKWAAKLGVQKPGTATLLVEGKGFSFRNADLLSLDKRQRTKALERALAESPLLQDEQFAWRAIAAKGALNDIEFVELMTAFGHTPEALTASLARPRHLNLDTLVPDEPAYYYRLLADAGSAASLAAYIEGPLAGGLKRIAKSSVARVLIPFDLLAEIKREDLEFLLEANDPFTLLFGFEMCAVRLCKAKAYAELGSKFLEKLFADNKAVSDRCALFSACAVLSLVGARRVFPDHSVPLWWFRLAVLDPARVQSQRQKDDNSVAVIQTVALGQNFDINSSATA